MPVTLEAAAQHARNAGLRASSPRALRFVKMRLVVGALLGMACASTPHTPRAAAASPTSLDVPRIVVTPSTTLTLDELFAEAHTRADKGDFAGAAARFDRVVELEPNGELAPEALFLAGEA